MLLGVAFGVAYNLVRVESGTVLEVEEVLVPEVMEEPVVVDNPKIEKQKTLNTIEDVTRNMKTGRLLYSWSQTPWFFWSACQDYASTTDFKSININSMNYRM